MPSLSSILAGALGITALAARSMWQMYIDAAHDRDAAQAALKTRFANEQVVTEYVDRIVRVPGPERIRTVVSRLCDHPRMPSASGADDAAGADTDVRPDIEGVARDIGAAERNKLKLEALQEVLRSQVK